MEMGITREPELPAARPRPVVSRRQLLARGVKLGLGLPAASAVLAACAKAGTSIGGAPSTGANVAENVTGKAVLLNYVGWIGSSEVNTFQQEHPGATIKQAPDNSSSIGGKVQIIKNNPSQYDFTLGDESFVGQALLAGILGEVDFSKIPNIQNVTPSFRESYSHGIPTDYGKVGIGYRADIVKEGITSWADFWNLAPKYSGQVVIINLDRDCMGSTMKYLGFSGNSTDPGELEKCKEALIQIKPHLEALKYYNVGSGLVKGTTAMVMDWDFDVALNQRKNPNIKWVLPEEGAVAYLEGWVAIKGTPHLDLVEAFMNFHLDPKEYADFVNTTGTAFLVPSATPFIKKSISQNPILFPDEAVLSKVEFEKFLGAATADWAKTWDEFKSA